MTSSVLRAAPSDLADALDVWQAANAARGHPPTTARIDRVRAKLAAVDAHVVLGRLDGRAVAMGLAEPGRADGGAGAAIPGHTHVSMVFVHPEHWGAGHGGRVLAALHAEVGERATLWTRAANARARRLYEKAGYRATGRTAALPAGDRIIELEWVR